MCVVQTHAQISCFSLSEIVFKIACFPLDVYGFLNPPLSDPCVFAFFYSATLPTTNSSRTTIRIKIVSRNYSRELNNTQSVQYKELVTELTTEVS